MLRFLVVLYATVVLAGARSAVAAPIPADEKFAVKLYTDPEVGTVTIEKRYSKNAMTMKFTDGQGNAVSETKTTEIKDMEYELTILKVADKKAVKFSHKYTKASIEDANGKREPMYANRTVVFEWKDNRYVVSVEDGKEFDGDDMTALEKEINEQPDEQLNRALEPSKSVKVGDTWNADGKKVAEAFNRDKTTQFDGDTVKTTVKLVKAFKQDKQQWGSFELTFDLPIKSIEGANVLAGSTVSMKGTMETPIDGAIGGVAKVTGKGKVKATVAANGETLTFEGDSEFSGENSTTLKKK